MNDRDVVSGGQRYRVTTHNRDSLEVWFDDREEACKYWRDNAWGMGQGGVLDTQSTSSYRWIT